MHEIDTVAGSETPMDNEDELFMKHVVDGDHEILFLDSYLKDLFSESLSVSG